MSASEIGVASVENSGIGVAQKEVSAQTNNYRNELYTKVNINRKNETLLNRYFSEDEPIFKSELSEKASELYDFKDKGTDIKILVHDNPNIMKLVCLVRFIWGNEDDDNMIAKYMLMGYRLNTDDSDWTGKKLTKTSPGDETSELEGEVEEGMGGGAYGSASGMTGMNKKQKERVANFKKFISLLNNGIQDSRNKNIESKIIADVSQFFPDHGEAIKKEFTSILGFSSMRGKGTPLIAYSLYEINKSIRDMAHEESNKLNILDLGYNNNNMYYYKFSVNYKCVIVDNALYYQKNVENIDFYEKKAKVNNHHNEYLIINGDTEEEAAAAAAAAAAGPAPPDQDKAAGVVQRATRNWRARTLMNSRAREKEREGPEPPGQEADAEVMAANEAFAEQDPATGGCMSRAESGGGYRRKLKRRELNTMSLNELKQLHRINGIKMNSNKTVNALINNYIKNYK